MSTRYRIRRNILDASEEKFRPPVFKPNDGWRNKLENCLRRFLDLQAGSVWSDLKCELQAVSGNILDIGCGAQVYRNLVPKDVGYLGIDTEDAKLHFGYEVPDTIYFSGDSWPVAEQSFQWVLCTEVLEHIPDSAAFLQKIAKVLRPDGSLLLTVPFAARWHYIPYDYWRFTPSGLDRLLTQAGFTDIRIHARGNPLTVACYKLMALPLMLLLTTDSRVAHGTLKRLTGLLLSPVLLLAALVANLSLRMDWGDDCLGYTVTAKRSS